MKDGFSISSWWESKILELPNTVEVLRAVLTNSPNSIPPERLFSILNNSFGDDQDRALADSLHGVLTPATVEYNTRTR